jgi:uncharacterized protein (DUF736 family)
MPMSGNQITKLGDLIMDMKDNTIMLFVNDKEGNDKRPDYSGKALWNGEEIAVSIWKNVSKAGNNYLSGQLQPPYNGSASNGSSAGVSDDVPF